RYKAKIRLQALARRPPQGRLVLVTGINPTPAGEGKSTVTVGVTQALRKLGKNAGLCIREPSLGPVFGGKGGAAGGGYAAVGPTREERFVIIPGSEIMAIMALASGIEDLERRLARIIVGLTPGKTAVRASDLKAQGALTLLLKDAINPNLVQTLEGGPAFIHCGPFGNIAHGCNSVVATRLALAVCDIVLTEAGFGADLGAEKFFDIKCRMAG